MAELQGFQRPEPKLVSLCQEEGWNERMTGPICSTLPLMMQQKIIKTQQRTVNDPSSEQICWKADKDTGAEKTAFLPGRNIEKESPFV